MHSGLDGLIFLHFDIERKVPIITVHFYRLYLPGRQRGLNQSTISKVLYNKYIEN